MQTKQTHFKNFSSSNLSFPLETKTLNRRKFLLTKLFPLFDRISDNKFLLYKIFLLTFFIFILYHSSINWMWNIWVDDREYSHGFIVLPISIYLVWVKRYYYYTLQIKPAFFSGTMFLLTSTFLLIVGKAGAVIQIETISLLILRIICC